MNTQLESIRDYLQGHEPGHLRRFTRQNENRLTVLRFAYPSWTDVQHLPKNETERIWTDGVAYFRLLPFVKGQSKARFQVRCPICKKWFSVGKFFLHTPVHEE